MMLVVLKSGATDRDLVAPLALASIAAGADGIILEVHPEPEKAWTDGAQTISLDDLRALMEKVQTVAAAVGRELYSD